jgi:hypothetical protein
VKFSVEFFGKAPEDLTAREERALAHYMGILAGEAKR